jgi:ABC-type bacteriocin/lantibiotic exporter with double-glycine peptidase domain
MKLALIIAIAMAFACFANAVTLINPPHYSQKDPKWGKNTLGSGPPNIGQMGCWLSALTSMIANEGIKVNGAIPNPGTMNSYWKGNGGIKGHSVQYKAPEMFGFRYEGKVTSKSTVMDALKEGKYALLHVKNKSHWVLVTGYDDSGYSVMDPADVRTSYKYSEPNEVAIYAPPESNNSSEQPEEPEQSERPSRPEPEQVPSSSSSSSDALINPPHYSQKDSKWGSKTLGFGSNTIAQKGCFLSVITSMIANEGIKVHGSIPNPDTMNSWFKSNNGFKSGLLQYKAAERLGFSYEGFVDDEEAVIDAMKEGKYALLHVKNRSHWVLATGYDADGYTVMDPADVRTTYDYDEVNEVAIYTAP